MIVELCRQTEQALAAARDGQWEQVDRLLAGRQPLFTAWEGQISQGMVTPPASRALLESILNWEAEICLLADARKTELKGEVQDVMTRHKLKNAYG